MSINSINEAFDRKFAASDEPVRITDNDRLKQELLRVENSLERQGNYNIKAYEVAFQDVIERFFPDQSWWEVVDFDIFSDLFANRNPIATIDNIISHVKKPAEVAPVVEAVDLTQKTGTSKQKNEAVDSVVNATRDDFGSDEAFYDSPEYKISRYEIDLQELIDIMHELYNNGKVKDSEQYLAALSEAYNLIEDVETFE